MSKFVSTDAGWVNLDFVARISERRERCGIPGISKQRVFTFDDAQGKTIGRSSLLSDHLDMAELTAPIVPAAQGMVATVIDLYHNGDSRPTDNDVFVARRLVVAWRVLANSAVPVLAEEPMSGSLVLLEMPDGKLLVPGDCEYSSLEFATRDFLQMKQHEWDRSRSRPRASA